MASGAVTIGRKQYAVGLYWENSPSGRISQAAKEAARQSATPVDYYVTRSGNEQGRVPQFGLSPRNERFKAGMPSLAGCLAMQQPGSWVGAFRFREGVGIVIARDDLIVPDGDLFFADESEARDRLFEEIAIGGFERIYAPEAWGVPSADTMPVSLLLNDNAKIRLRAVALSSRAKAILAICAVVLALAAGIGWYIQEQIAAEEAALQSQMEALERARRAAQGLIGTQKPVYPPPDRKWEKRPNPLEVVDACQGALQEVTVGLAGWRLVGLNCTELGLSVSWGRKKGFSAPPPESSVTDRADMAMRTVSITPLEPRGDEELIDPDFVTKRYLRQNWPGRIERIPDDPPPPPPPNYEGEWNPPPAPWVKRSFTLKVPVLPWAVPEFLGDMPGVIVQELALDGSGKSWTIKGVIYENRR